MTREPGLCCGLSAAMASRPAPGRHDVSCTLVVKLSSATRLSLLAGQPKLTRASLLSQVPGTAVRWPVARFSTSTRQRAAHGGAQAIWVALAAITASKVRLACRVAGFHNW